MRALTTRFFAGVAPGSYHPIGNVWRFTARGDSFYVDLGDGAESFHLSVHAPTAAYPRHRFHIKVDRVAARTAHLRGQFAAHGIGRKGYAFDGHEVEPGVHHVLTVRWTAAVMRKKYRKFVLAPTIPTASDDEPGMLMSRRVGTGDAIDLEIFLSYERGYVHGGARAVADRAVLGPIKAAGGFWLSATFMRRLERDYPTPTSLQVPVPSSRDQPNRLLGGGPANEGESGPYWFVETVTSRSLIEASLDAWVAKLNSG